MTPLIENIENNYFGTDLRKRLFELKSEDSNSPEIDMVINLFRQTLTNDLEIESNELLDNFSSIELIKNIEIRGRWHEYLSQRFTKQKREHLRKSVFYYLEIFTSTKNNDYLIHSLRLVKTAKGLFKDEINSIYEKGKSELLRLDKPFLQKEIVIELFSLYPEQTKIDFGGFLKNKIENQTTNHNYPGVFWLIESLKEIKVVSKTESKILHAKNYENEGDYQSEDKKPNTYYPTILITYQKGLRELKSIQCDENFRKRLENKVLKEQKEQLKMHFALSQEYLETNKVFENLINDFGNSCLKQFKVFDFESGFSSLISFPISLGIKSEKEQKSTLLFSKMFDNYVRINSKGKAVGKTDSENFHEIKNKRIWRECTINFLKKAKWKMDEDKILNRDIVFYHILEKCDSKFIPPDRKWLFANGIYNGFNNDFITSAHILIPQLENSLKYILENQGVLTSKIYDEIQHDNMLGGLLDIYIKKNGHDIFYEMKDFLLENSSVNFRNELCHGLLSPFIIEHYGIYVWWITLKLIFDKEKVFEIESTKC
ncbi:hypothetical protein SAMN05192545_1512 [Maribacter dokdonensis]|uniref:DUF4209 domain-containing protein n=1 Tax=Maribacter dokdonensis TaxID=320912 RepID=A0ABY0UDQ6_9FLAO|nr:hypothetical protein [Maribacter dokdonensis]SDS50094.1 hypothetical protein SAMN05192545_1512 [Maribacter dokdonensis]